MNKADMYMHLSLKTILKEGHWDHNPRPKWSDGTPAHTLSINGQFHQYDISKNEFPITTLRPINFIKAIGEIIWIYQDGSNNLDVLAEKYGVHWWDNWDIGDRTIGSCYGATVSRHNMMKKLLDGIKNDPYSRRHIINLWQEEDFKDLHSLKPCCYQVQFLVRDKYLDMILYQRSSDWLVAGNINQIQYVALLMMVAHHCGYEPGMFYHMIANQQIYDRHLENAEEMLKRCDRFKVHELSIIDYELLPPDPVLVFNPDKRDFWSYKVDDFQLLNYEPMAPQLEFEVAV